MDQMKEPFAVENLVLIISGRFNSIFKILHAQLMNLNVLLGVNALEWTMFVIMASFLMIFTKIFF